MSEFGFQTASPPNGGAIVPGVTPIIGGAVGQILFQGAGNVIQESPNLFWDNTGFLAIGTNTPVAPSGYNGITINSASAGSYIWFQTGGVTKYTIGSESNVNYHNLIAGTSFLIRSGSSSYFNVVQSTGNIQIGTTTDAGFRLDVNGTFRALVSTETNPFVIQHTNGNYATIIIGNGSQLSAGQMGMYFNGSPIWTWNGSAFRLPGNIISTQNNPSTLLISGGWGGSTIGTSLRLSSNTGNQGVFTATSGTQSTVEIGNTSNETWSPSSGNATYNLLSVVPRINTTGTYSGIVRGIFYSPTLTSVTGVDHRAIETTTGNVLFGTTSGNVGIGTNSPGSRLHISSAAGNSTSISTIAASNYSQRIQNTTDVAGTYSGLAFMNPFDIQGYIACNQVGTGFGAGGDLIFANRPTGGGSAITERMRIFSTGNIGINTTTDAGFRLDVNGTARVQGNFNVSGGQGITTINPNSITGGTDFFVVRTASLGTFITARENGNLFLGPTAGSRAILYEALTFSYRSLSSMNFNNGGGFVPSNQLNQAGLYINASFTNAGAGATSEGSIFQFQGNTATTVGDVTLNQISMKPTYNNTGGTTINRGIFYNPTLTSLTGTTHYAFHSTSGWIRFENLPTSSAGLPPGTLYNNLGVLMIA